MGGGRIGLPLEGDATPSLVGMSPVKKAKSMGNISGMVSAQSSSIIPGSPARSGGSRNQSYQDFQALSLKLNPPTVEIDNKADAGATIVRIDSANRHGILLEVVQHLTQLSCIIRKARISSDGGWFFDDFHVVGKDQKKVEDEETLCSIQSMFREATTSEKTAPLSEVPVTSGRCDMSAIVEITTDDFPGLLSLVTERFYDLGMEITKLTQWAQRGRIAMIITATYVGLQAHSDSEMTSVSDFDSNDILGKLQARLEEVFSSDNGRSTVALAQDYGLVRSEVYLQSRLHFLLAMDLEVYKSGKEVLWKGFKKEGDLRSLMNEDLEVTIENEYHSGYTVIRVVSKDRPALLFDTLCTFSNLGYDIYHATIDSNAEDNTAFQEYFVRHCAGGMNHADKEKTRIRIREHLVASVVRRVPHGHKIQFRDDNKPYILSRVANLVKEQGSNIAALEFSLSDCSNVADIELHVTTSSGNPIPKEQLLTTCEMLTSLEENNTANVQADLALTPKTPLSLSCESNMSGSEGESFFDFSMLEKKSMKHA